MELAPKQWIGKHLVTDKGFYKKMLWLILPVILQNIINQGVNMMDTVMVGNLGEVSISASSLANQFYQIFHFLCMGLSAAGLVLASQYWEGGKKATVKKVYTLVLQLVLMIGLRFAVVSFLFTEQIISIYTKDSDVIQEGGKYLRITAFIFLPHGFGLVIANLIRSVGNANMGLISSSAAFLGNIGCNYISLSLASWESPPWE